MLVLQRKVGERVMIGDDITLTVVEIRGEFIRLGIDAPRAMPVDRAEVVEAIRANGGKRSTREERAHNELGGES
jgi:carbon storage regulator